MTQRDLFIELYSKYIFNKYYYSRYIEEEYIQKFADMEIETMENLYEYYVYDYKLENKFYNAQPEVQGVLYALEYEDLEYQIDNLKSRKLSNKINLNKYKKYINDETRDFVKFVVSKINPELNSTKKAGELWTDYMQMIKRGNLALTDELIEKISKTRVKKIEDEYDFECFNIKVKNMLEDLENTYPLNLQKVLKSKKSIDAKYNELKKDIRKSKEALNKVQSIYLQVYDSKGLES